MPAGQIAEGSAAESSRPSLWGSRARCAGELLDPRVDVDDPVGDVIDHEDAVLDERVLLHQLPDLVRVHALPDRHRAEPSGPRATHDEEPAIDPSIDERGVLVPARLILRQAARPGRPGADAQNDAGDSQRHDAPYRV